MIGWLDGLIDGCFVGWMNDSCNDGFMEENTLPNDKILNWSKFKAFADDKIID